MEGKAKLTLSRFPGGCVLAVPVLTVCLHATFPRTMTMTIAVGDTIPDVKLVKATADGPQQVSAAEFFKGRRVALFSVPEIGRAHV